MKSVNPNITSVAEAAGVSAMTVSRVLRNHPNVSRETREKVEAAILQSGYRPNPLVSTLMAQMRSTRGRNSDVGTIAWVSPHPNREAWWGQETTRRMFLGAQDRSAQLGFKLEDFYLKAPGMTPRRLEQILQVRGIRGVLIAPVSRLPGHCSMNLQHFAVGSIGHSVWRPALHQAINNHFRTLLLAARHLKRNGYRKIGFYSIRALDLATAHAFSGAFLFHQSTVAKKFRVPMLVEAGWHRAVFEKWVTQHEPDVIMTGHYPALEWLKEMGRDVPQDIGFVHLDLQPSMKPCSGMDMLHELIGAEAINLIILQFNQNSFGLPENARTVLTEARWVQGRTVRPMGRPEEIAR